VKQSQDLILRSPRSGRLEGRPPAPSPRQRQARSVWPSFETALARLLRTRLENVQAAASPTRRASQDKANEQISERRDFTRRVAPVCDCPIFPPAGAGTASHAVLGRLHDGAGFHICFPIAEMMRLHWSYIEDPANPGRGAANEIVHGRDLVRPVQDGLPRLSAQVRPRRRPVSHPGRGAGRVKGAFDPHSRRPASTTAERSLMRRRLCRADVNCDATSLLSSRCSSARYCPASSDRNSPRMRISAA
jgi:hypothetical protein